MFMAKISKFARAIQSCSDVRITFEGNICEVVTESHALIQTLLRLENYKFLTKKNVVSPLVVESVPVVSLITHFMKSLFHAKSRFMITSPPVTGL